MGQRLGPFDIAALTAAAEGTIVKKVGGVYVGVVDPAGPLNVLGKDNNNDGQTLAMQTWNIIDLGPGGFGMNLPVLDGTNDGQKVWLEMANAATNIFTLTPGGSDNLDWVGSGNALAAGANTLYEAAGYSRVVELLADFGSNRWVVTESPSVDTVVKANVTVVTFDALPAVTLFPAGSGGIGTALLADADGTLTIDGQLLALGDSILVANEGTPDDIGNGIYVVGDPGSGGDPFVLLRRTDAHHAAYLRKGLECRVELGNTFADTHWRLRNTAALLAGGIDTVAQIFEPVELIKVAFGNAEDGRFLPPNSYVRATYTGGSPTFLFPETVDYDGTKIVLEIVSGDAVEVVDLESGNSGNDSFLITDVGTAPGVLKLKRSTAFAAPPRRLTFTADAANLQWVVEEEPSAVLTDKVFVSLVATGPIPSFSGSGEKQGRTLTATGTGLLSIDNSPVVLESSVLLLGQSLPKDNGVYDVVNPGAGGISFILSRRTDADLDSYYLNGFRVQVQGGTRQKLTSWEFQDNDIDIDIDDLEFKKAGGPLVVFPFTLTGSTDDFSGEITDPYHSSALYADIIALTLGAARALTGMDSLSSEPPVWRKIITNVDATFNLSITHNDGNSLAANQFHIPGGGPLVLIPGDSATFDYDTNISKWRLA